MRESCSKRDDVFSAPLTCPGTQHVVRIIGEWPYQGDPLHVVGYWQNRRSAGKGSVFQHDKRSFSSDARQGKTLRPKHGAGLFPFVSIRTFEQTEGKFHAQDTADGFVQGGLANLTGTHQLRQVLVIQTAHHIHVHTGEKRFASSSCAIVGDPVRDEFRDGGVVAIYNSLESPLAFQNLFQGEWIRS